MTNEVEYLTVQQTAEYLGVSRRRVWDMIRAGTLNAIQNPLDRREKLVERGDVEKLARFARPKKDQGLVA